MFVVAENTRSKNITVSGIPKNYSSLQKNFWFENILQKIFNGL